MKKLIQGIVDFRKNMLPEYREKFSKLALGHYPDTLFVACCDSRVVPNVFASTDPGDLFVLRNIGNLIPPYDQFNQATDNSVAATLEFSLIYLNVSDIVICGHSECAAMRAFVDKNSQITTPTLTHWLKYAVPSYQQFKNHHDEHCKLTPHNKLSQINVIQQLEHLKTYPEIQKRLQNKQLRIHGWWFDLATADVYCYEPDANDFVIIEGTEAEKILAAQ